MIVYLKLRIIFEVVLLLPQQMPWLVLIIIIRYRYTNKIFHAVANIISNSFIIINTIFRKGRAHNTALHRRQFCGNGAYFTYRVVKTLGLALNDGKFMKNQFTLLLVSNNLVNLQFTDTLMYPKFRNCHWPSRSSFPTPCMG